MKKCNPKFDFLSPHNGEYWYKCETCGATDWCAYYDKFEKGEPLRGCPNFEVFPPGRYYVGDLCYYLEEIWDSVCDHLGEEVFDLEGKKVGMLSTLYGDGSYFDQEGDEYFVDSGTIGCVRVEDFTFELPKHRGWSLVDFHEPFEVWSENGVLFFGRLRIDTNE